MAFPGIRAPHNEQMPLTYEVARDEPLVTIRGDSEAADEWRAILASVQGDLRGRAGPVGVLRDRLRDHRAAAAPVDVQTVLAMAGVIAEWWSGMRLCGIAVLTRTAHDVPAQVAVALGDARGIPLMAFDAEDVALSWLRGLLRAGDGEERPPGS